MDGNAEFIGLVRDGRFILLVPRSAFGGWVRLTGIHMQAAQPPDSAELDLAVRRDLSSERRAARVSMADS